MKDTEVSTKPDMLLMISSWKDVLKELGYEEHELVARRAADTDELVLTRGCSAWVDQVQAAVEDVRSRWRLFPPRRWVMMKMLGIKLPEYQELKDAAQRLHQLWYKDRPGVLKK